MRKQILRSGLAVCVLAMAPSLPSQDPDVSYRIGIHPRADRTELEVRMEFRGDASGMTLFELPQGGYGTPRVWESVRGLRAEGAELEEGDDPAVRRLRHAGGAPIALRYTVSVDPTANEGVAYRPSVGPEHFHFFDHQWRSRVRREGERRYRLGFDSVPEGWTVYSNLGEGAGPYTVTSSEAELSAFLAGGDYDRARFPIADRPVGVYVRGFEDPDRIASDLREIIGYQGEQFGSFAGSHYVISLSPRDEIRAGVAIRDAFVCLANPEIGPIDLEVLLAHEFFHNWLPRSAWIGPWRDGSSLDEFRFDWFLEGFAEYVARRMLLDSGKWGMDDFVELFNRDLREQARNPQRDVSLAVVERAILSGNFTNRHERTSYFRGPLIALMWDLELRERGKGTVVEVVRAFVNRGRASGGALGEEEFFELLEGFGLNAREVYDRHIVAGRPPVLPADIFAPEYTAHPVRFAPSGGGAEVETLRFVRR